MTPTDDTPTVAADGARLTRLVELGMTLAGSASEGELLQNLADAARELASARYAAIGVFDDDGSLREFVTAGIDEATRRAIGGPPTGRGLLGAIAREDSPIRLDDLSADSRATGFPEGHPPMTSFLGAPIRLRGEVYGTIYIADRRNGPFTPDDQSVIEALATYAAIAVSSTERFEEQQSQLHGLEEICSITLSMFSRLDRDELLPDVARRTRTLLGCDTVAVGLWKGDIVHFPHAHGAHALEMETMRVPAGDATELARQIGSELRLHATAAEMESPSGRVGALVAVGSAPLNQWKVHALAVLADQAASAMGSAEGFSEQRRRLTLEADRRAKRLEERLVAESRRRALAAQEDERSRIARELHDDTAQLLTGLGLRLKALSGRCEPGLQREVESLRDHVKDVGSAVRQILRRLRPDDLERGLSGAIHEQAERVHEASDCSVTVEVDPLPPLSNEVELVLYRAAQETLTNVARHSEAANASVTLTAQAHRLRLTVEDDGKGFDPTHTGDRLGLEGLSERVSLVGGNLRVTSAPGTGTAVIIDVPAWAGAAPGDAPRDAPSPD